MHDNPRATAGRVTTVNEMSEPVTDQPYQHNELRVLAKQWLSERAAEVSRDTTSNRARTVDYMLKRIQGKPFTYDTLTNLFIEWSRDETRNQNSNNHWRSDFGAFIKWLKSRKIIDWELDRKSVFPSRPSMRKPITEEDYQRLLLMTQKNQKFNYLEYAVRTAWETGLRLNDVCHLTWKNICFTERSLKVFPHKTRKAQKLVELPLSKDYLDYLKRLYDCHDPNTPYISPDLAFMYDKYEGSNGRLSVHLSLLFKYAQMDKNKSFHCFRTGVITRLAAKGMNMGLIANCLAVGLEHVMAYCKPTLEDKRKAIEMK